MIETHLHSHYLRHLIYETEIARKVFLAHLCVDLTPILVWLIP
jgi:hypothetical protein